MLCRSCSMAVPMQVCSWSVWEMGRLASEVYVCGFQLRAQAIAVLANLNVRLWRSIPTFRTSACLPSCTMPGPASSTSYSRNACVCAQCRHQKFPSLISGLLSELLHSEPDTTKSLIEEKQEYQDDAPFQD